MSVCSPFHRDQLADNRPPPRIHISLVDQFVPAHLCLFSLCRWTAMRMRTDKDVHMCPTRWKRIRVKEMSNRGHLLELPDEILLLIFKQLPMLDVLSFLAHVHPRLHGLAHDFLYVRRLDLTGVSTIRSRCIDLCPTADEVLSRLVANTLPRLHEQVHQMTVESDSIKQIIAAGTYPQLYSLSLRHFKEEFLGHCLTGIVVDLLHCP